MLQDKFQMNQEEEEDCDDGLLWNLAQDVVAVTDSTTAAASVC